MNKAKKKGRMTVFFWGVFVVLVLYTLLMFLLFALGLNISLKHQMQLNGALTGKEDYFGLPDLEYWKLLGSVEGNGFLSMFDNYKTAWKALSKKDTISYYGGLFKLEQISSTYDVNVVKSVWYMLVYAGGGSLVATFVPMLMGYLCAKYQNKGSAFLYLLVLFVMATPIVGTTSSMLNLMRRLRLYNTFIGDWLRKASFTNMYFLIFYAYFKNLASSYDEAAEIDGASQLNVMFRICMPLAMNIFWTVFLILFVAFWNDYTTPMLFLPGKPTLSYLVYWGTTGGKTLQEKPQQMAALMLFAVPIIILFTIFNKRLMSNMTMGGIKE